jgi:transcriptional regulator with XRE-family HTH domain
MVLTLAELSAKSGVSPSHLGRIEMGERFPSARVLHKIAKPLGFNEGELFTYAGFLPVRPSSMAESFSGGRLDPYVARVLSQEPVETQRTVVAVLSVLKSMAKNVGSADSKAKAG